MPNHFAKFGISDAQLMAHIRNSAEVDAGLNDFMENEFIPYARELAPVDTGDYAAGIKVTQRAKGGRGEVSATNWKSHFIEYGTGGDTPTPELAVMAKTVEHFGGTMDGHE